MAGNQEMGESRWPIKRRDHVGAEDAALALAATIPVVSGSLGLHHRPYCSLQNDFYVFV